MGRTAVQELTANDKSDRRVGPFELVRQLGRGGFAPVWLAREVYGDVELRTVAVKLFDIERGPRADLLSTRSRGALIAEEARALCRVEHPNVVRFHALYTDESRGVIALAMEYASGASLASVLAARGPMSPLDVIGVGVAVASALASVHAAGLVHRDVKADNVVDAAGIYKLIDFGIAAAETKDAAFARETRAAVVVDDLPLDLGGATQTTAGDPGALSPAGTPGYVDPERIASPEKVATPASDLYGLGVLLFECLTGSLPAAIAAKRAGAQGLDANVLMGKTPSPNVRDVEPKTPVPLARVVDALLQPTAQSRPANAEVVAMELESARRELSGRVVALPPEDVGPFRGLERFEESDRDVYFGRRNDIASALEVLRSRGLLALVGPSGSGKSSLVRAGLLPAIVEGALGPQPAEWEVVTLSPGPHARDSLIDAMSHLVGESLATEARRGSLTPETFAAEVTTRLQASGKGMILFVDQMEELVVRGDGQASRDWTGAAIGAFSAQARAAVRVVVTLRHEMLEAVIQIPVLGRAVLAGVCLLRPLPDMAWPEVVDAGLRAYSYQFAEPALRTQVLQELQGTAMPLAQFALAQLWRKRNTAKKTIDWAAFQMIGGISGALDKHAEKVFASISRGDAQRVASLRQVLLALTTPQGTRSSLPIASLTALAGVDWMGDALRELETARLIVPSPSGVTLAHDALVTKWKRLWGWVVDAREERLLAVEVESAAERWMVDHDPSLLFRQRRLALAEEIRRTKSQRLSPVAEQFLRASRGAARKSFALVSGVALLVLGGAAAGTMTYVRALREDQTVVAAALARSKASLELAQAKGEEADAARGKAADARDACDKELRNLEDRLRSSSDTELATLRRRLRAADAAKATDMAASADPSKAAVPAKKECACLKGDPLCLCP